jgi:3-deoxy-D-manno-octulosonic acid kinase
VKIRSQKQQSQLIVYDADRVQEPGPLLFDPVYWERQGRLAGHAVGRGSALLLETDFGPAVLRQYLRGGWPARISRDRYLFTGFTRARPMVEFNMLASLTIAGLPVPEPLAALCERKGLYYRGWLLTRRILGAFPLADRLAERSADRAFWRRMGREIRRFHNAGVVHADLNARNILLGPDDAIHLVDFDRARISAENARAFAGNLMRLKRSLKKLWPPSGRERLDSCWDDLLLGYGTTAELL